MKLWVVGKSTDLENPFAWEFCGVFDDENNAVDRCLDDMHFVGPVVLNQQVPDEHMAWPGCYYPKAMVTDG